MVALTTLITPQGYEDTSYTAKIQCRYTDLILLNKWEMADERQLDSVMDSVYTLYDGTIVPVPPVVKVPKDFGLCPDVVFGLDTALFTEIGEGDGVLVDSEHQAKEVDIVQVVRNISGKIERKECGVDGCAERGVHKHDHGHEHGHSHEEKEAKEPKLALDKKALDEWLGDLPKDDFYRVKGLVRLSGGDGTSELAILNWAFGTWDYTHVPASDTWSDCISRITIMGRGLRLHLRGIDDAFAVAKDGESWFVPAEVD